jgi:ribose/xylose/arabinose/galactoside ABC-type transport system permease subunit
MLCGLLNGGMLVALKVHPFIITLGTMSIFRGNRIRHNQWSIVWAVFRNHF